MSEVRRGYKQTEVGVIPEDWETKPCSAVSALITVGIVIRPTQYYVKQGIPALRSANVREDGVDENDMVFISERANALLSKSQVRTDDVLTVRTGYPGTSAVVPPHLSGANCIDILITRPSKAINSYYLAAWINSPHGKYQILRDQGGLAQQHFNVGDLRDLVIALPPTIGEQEAIAEALSDADALIESLEQLLTKKRQIKQGAMQELLTGKKRLPGFQSKLGHKQTEVGLIPEDWEIEPVGRAFEICNELRLPISRTLRAQMAGEYPYYGPTAIQGWIAEYRVDGEYALIGEDGDHFLKWQTNPMTSLVQGKFNVNNHAHLVRGTKNATSWFYWSFAHRDLTQFLTRQGAGRYKLTKAVLERIPCALPAKRIEQESIAEALSDMGAGIAALESKLTKARQLKQGMMQNLLTGKIRLV
jgi:type I restriction enzyme S subunit